MVAKKILTEGLKKLKPYKPRKSKNDELDSFKTKKVHQTIKRRNKKRSKMAVEDHKRAFQPVAVSDDTEAAVDDDRVASDYVDA